MPRGRGVRRSEGGKNEWPAGSPEGGMEREEPGDVVVVVVVCPKEGFAESGLVGVVSED